MSMSRDFRNLEVFQMADVQLVHVLAILDRLEGPARFAIRNQLARAALSVPLNLVEGCQRTTTAEYARFVEIAAGSAAETRYLLSVASRLATAVPDLEKLEPDYERLTQRLQTLRGHLAKAAAGERHSRTIAADLHSGRGIKP